MKSRLFGILLLIIQSCTSYQPIGSFPDEIKGNWFNAQNMELKLCIQDDFIFKGNQFFEIESSYFKENKYLVEFTNGQKIEFESSKDSIYFNGYWLSNKFDPLKRLPQSSNPILSRGTAHLQGYFHQQPDSLANQPVSFFVSDYILGTQHEQKLEVDSLGIFQTTFQINSSQDLWFYTYPDGPLYRIFIGPGDTLSVFFDDRIQMEKAHFAGRNAPINYDLFKMDSVYHELVINPKQENSAYSLEPMDYLEFRKEIKTKDKWFLTEYCQTGTCSDLFQEWFKVNSEVDYYINLMRYSFMSANYGWGGEKKLSPQLKEQYKNAFIDSVDQNSSAYLLSSKFFILINSLSNGLVSAPNDLEIREYNLEYLNAILENEQLSSTLNTIQKELLHAMILDGRVKDDLTPTEKEVWWSMEDDLGNALKVIEMKLSLQFIVRDIMQVESENMRDLILSQRFYNWYILNKNYELMDYSYDLFSKNIKTAEYKNLLQEYYYESKSQEQKLGVLRSDIRFFDGNGNDLLKEIIKTNPNKLVLLDFWGTWCQPCIRDFKIIKEQNIKYQDLVSVYLCIQSLEKNWKNALIEYDPGGIHYFLTRRQQEELIEKFNVNSFPTYILIDKKGKIYRDVPKPVEADHFLKFIKPLLPS